MLLAQYWLLPMESHKKLLFVWGKVTTSQLDITIESQEVSHCPAGDPKASISLSEPDFYGDLVYTLKKIVGSNNLSAQFIKIISHYKKVGYNIKVLQLTACLVVNPIMVGNFAFLFNCMPVGRTSDSMMVPTKRHLLMRW